MKRNFLALLCVVALVLSLASCSLLGQFLPGDEPADNTCEHTYSDSWSSDAAEHWHAASCDHAELKTNVASHVDADEDGKCDVCDYTMTPAHEHNFVDGSCECGETDPNYVPPHTHNFVDGMCACGESDPNYVAPHEHNFVDGKCECGEEDPNYVPPHEHNFVEGKCECGEEDPDYVPACAHEFDMVVGWHPLMVAADCVTSGVDVYICNLCGETKTEETGIDPDAHAFWGEEEVITAADCTTQTNGLKKVHCANEGCTAIEEVEIFYSEAHNWDVQTDVYATCTENGAYYAVCTLCGEVDAYDIPAGGHYNWYLTCGESGNCLECDAEFTKQHDTSFNPATCTDPAFCMNCWSSVGEALGHNYVGGICENCGGPDYGYMDTIEIPSTPTLEYLEGTWFGEEYGSADEGYDGYYTFVIVLGADGKGTVTHSELGSFNVTYTGVYEGYIMMVTNSTPTLYLNYVDGKFVLRTEYSFDTSMTYGTYLEMFKVAGKATEPTPPAHEHNFVDGKCECGEEDPNYVPPTETAPAEISREYLAGTWYGTETGAFNYEGDHTFVVIIDDNGKTGIVKHSALGEFKITGITILDGNSVMMDITTDTYMISLEYNNGVFTLADGKNFTYGRENFTMSKNPPAHEHNFVDGKCECGETDPNYVEPAPAEISREYLAGTWYGTETGAFDYAGDHTFVVIIDDNGKTGIVKHSALGEFKITGITILDGNSVMMDLTTDTYMISLEYNNGVFTLADGKNFTYGRDNFTMSKNPPAHEHNFVEGKCECGEEDPNYVPPHTHNFVEGKCECGESDPNYVPPTEEAPEILTYDYLTGTWYGTETSWNGAEHTFTIEFDGQMGTVTHSELGTFSVIVEISYGMIYAYPECEFDMSVWMYEGGVIYLFDSMPSFTGGDVLSMTKA